MTRATTTTSVFDATKIRNALLNTGMSVNEASFRVHMPFKTLQQIVDGQSTPHDLRITTIKRLADIIGLPVRSLFAEPDTPAPLNDETPSPTADDATTIIAVLYDRGTNPSINHDLAKGLGWTLERLHNAYDEAEHRLAPAGLRLIRTHGEGSIAPIHDHTEQRAAVEHARADNTGMAVDSYRAAHQLLTGSEVLPGRRAYRRRLCIGWLANLGIVNTESREPVLTDAALEAFPTA
jgi:hypothetical protein